jgi:hypothetical protein
VLPLRLVAVNRRYQHFRLRAQETKPNLESSFCSQRAVASSAVAPAATPSASVALAV